LGAISSPYSHLPGVPWLPEACRGKETAKTKRKRASYTIGVSQERWSRTAVLNKGGRCQAILLPEPFQKLFDELVHFISEDDRYLGLGLVKINHKIELLHG
jgi:hypothetical protein